MSSSLGRQFQLFANQIHLARVPNRRFQGFGTFRPSGARVAGDLKGSEPKDLKESQETNGPLGSQDTKERDRTGPENRDSPSETSTTASASTGSLGSVPVIVHQEAWSDSTPIWFEDIAQAVAKVLHDLASHSFLFLPSLSSQPRFHTSSLNVHVPVRLQVLQIALFL